MTPAGLYAWDPVVTALAQQAPAWQPGTAHAYHALTFGWLVGELLRRATGSRPKNWLAGRVAGPLRVSMAFGADTPADDFGPVGEPVPEADAGVALRSRLPSSSHHRRRSAPSTWAACSIR